MLTQMMKKTETGTPNAIIIAPTVTQKTSSKRFEKQQHIQTECASVKRQNRSQHRRMPEKKRNPIACEDLFAGKLLFKTRSQMNWFALLCAYQPAVVSHFS